MPKRVTIFVLTLSIAACESNPSAVIEASNKNLSCMGRIDRRPDGVALISSAASVAVHLSGKNRAVYLNTDSTKVWKFSSTAPDVVSICLGTNDLSDGDGIKVRQPFDEEQFLQRYISFIQTIYKCYPHTKNGNYDKPG